MRDIFEILPPEESRGISAEVRWWKSPFVQKTKPFVCAISAVACLSFAVSQLNQFLTLRGVVNVPASRIYLISSALAAALGLLSATRLISLKWRNRLFVSLSIAVVISAAWLDRWAPRPQAAPQAAPSEQSFSKPQEPPPHFPEASELAKEIAKQLPKQKVIVPGKSTNSEGFTENLRGQTNDRIFVLAVDLTYDAAAKAFNFFNRGPANIYMWGDKLDSGQKVMETEPRTLTANGGSYHIWADKLIPEIQEKLASGEEVRIPLEVYITTEEKQQYILKYQIWARVNDEQLLIETQNLGNERTDFQ